MKITFLGSAAAEGIPFPYCDCPTCTHARKHKGKNVRKRCSYMINDNLVVDMGPDFFTSCAMHDVDMRKTKYALITHSHPDHFNVQNLKLRAQHFHKETKLPPLTLVGGPSTMTLLNQSGSKDVAMGLDRIPMLPYDSIDLPPYYVKSVKATHFPTVGDAMNYVIDDGEKKAMIASDTGVYQDEVWKHLENVELDLLVIEATRGNGPSNAVHMNVEEVQNTITKMQEVNAITEQTHIYATHFAHQYCPPHEELSKMLKQFGINCVYDGLEVVL